MVVPLGQTGERDDPNFPIRTAVTVLEVRRGSEAHSLLSSWDLSSLHEQNEAVAARIRLDYISGPKHEMMSFNSFSFGTVYLDEIALDYVGFDMADQDQRFSFDAYPPFTGEGWIAWEIRKGAELPYLAYQHLLIGVSDYGLTLNPILFELE